MYNQIMIVKVKNRLKKFLPLLILLALGLGIFIYIKSKTGIAVVTVQKAEVRTIAKTISASGETAVLGDYTKRALIGGSIKDLKFISGDTVKKGEVIIEMDKASLKASLDAAYATYLDAKSDMDSYDQRVVAAKATESIRKRERDEAWRVYMSDNGETNKQVYKNAEALYQTALATLSTLEGSKNTIQNTVYSGYSAYFSALANYNNAVVTAPADGQLALADLYSGSYVTVGQKLFDIVQAQNIVFKAEVDEADVSHLKVGMKTNVSLDSYPGEVFVGTVSSVDAKVQILPSGSAVIFADIVFVEPKILPILGLSGSADIEFDKSASIISISPDSVFEEAGKKYVYVVVADILVKKAVEVGFEGDEYIGVISGVSAGDTVVSTVTDQRLKEGQKVTVVTQ